MLPNLQFSDLAATQLDRINTTESERKNSIMTIKKTESDGSNLYVKKILK